MKFVVEAEALDRALRRIKPAIPSRSTIPILQTVRIEATADRLLLAGNNMMIAISTAVQASIETPGSAAIDADKLSDIARGAPAGAQIAFSQTADRRVSVTAGRARYRLATLDPDAFPAMPVPDGKPWTIRSGDIDRLLSGPRAVCADEQKPALHGVYLHRFEADERITLRSVALDTAALIALDAPWPQDADLPGGAGPFPGVIVPQDTIKALHTLAGDGNAEDPVQLAISETLFAATMGETILTSRLIDNKYPDYTVLDRGPHRATLAMDSDAVRAAVARAGAVAARTKSGAYNVTFIVRDEGLSIEARGPDDQHYSEDLDAEIDGEFELVSLQSVYIAASLDALVGDRLTLDVTAFPQGGTGLKVKLRTPADPNVYAFIAAVHDNVHQHQQPPQDGGEQP